MWFSVVSNKTLKLPNDPCGLRNVMLALITVDRNVRRERAAYSL